MRVFIDIGPAPGATGGRAQEGNAYELIVREENYGTPGDDLPIGYPRAHFNNYRKRLVEEICGRHVESWLLALGEHLQGPRGLKGPEISDDRFIISSAALIC